VKKLFGILAVLCAALTVVAVASAKQHETMLGAKLDAMQDHAASKGVGTFTATITGSKLSWHLTFKHLTGKAVAAHIHVGAKGKSGNVLIPLCAPCTKAAMGTVKLNAMELRDVTKAATYVNVHTAKYPNGEIRGQITAH
jgi:hypothetical protein